MSEQTAVGQITLVSVLDGEPGRPGLDGKPGEQGEPGQKGATGKGLDKIVTMYYLSTSSETPSGGQWSRERPKWRINTYLWTYQELHWVNPKEITKTDPQLSREWSASREIVRGERNLALKSGESQASDVNDDWLAFYELAKPLQKNTTYTVVCSANIKSTSKSAKIYLYHNGGSIRINTPMKDLGRGLYSLTIDPLSVSDSNSRIGMKNEPTTAAEPSVVNWFKVVEGEVTSYDWQPAPEDRKAELSQAVVDFNDKMGYLRSEVHSLNSKNEEKIVSMRQDINGIQMRVESKGALYKDLSGKLNSTMNTIQMKSYRLNQARLSSLDYELSFRLKEAQSVKLEVVYRWRDSNNYTKTEIVHTERFGIDSNHYHLISFVLPGLPGERGVLDFNFTNEQNKDFTIQDITIKENYQRGVLDTISSLSIEQDKISTQVGEARGQMSSIVQESDRIYSIISNSEYSMINRTEHLRKSAASGGSVVYSLQYGLKNISNQLLWRITSPRPTSITFSVKGRNLIRKDNVDLIENKTYWHYYTTNELGMIKPDDLLECNIRSLDKTDPGDIKVEFFEIPSIATVQSHAEQANDRISLMVAGRGEFDSLLTLLEDKIQLKASNIDLTGYVTMKDLDGSKGKTIIDGGVIKANSIKADRIGTGTIRSLDSEKDTFWNLDTGEFRSQGINTLEERRSVVIENGRIESTRTWEYVRISDGSISFGRSDTINNPDTYYRISYNTPRVDPYVYKSGYVAPVSSSASVVTGLTLMQPSAPSVTKGEKCDMLTFATKIYVPAFTGQSWTSWIDVKFKGSFKEISYMHVSSLTAKELLFNIRQVHANYGWVKGLQIQGAPMTARSGWPGGDVIISVMIVGSFIE